MESPTVAAATDAVKAIQPIDALEATHRSRALAWLASGVDVCRGTVADRPDPHLVAYFVLVDAVGRVLLVDHRKAGLWLPPGGHVERGEEPDVTVRRELEEELGVRTELFEGLPSNPLFLTWTRTVGPQAIHDDVSLWYVLDARSLGPLAPDPGEFHEVRWWSYADAQGLGDRADPHLGRFVAKLVDATG